MIEERVVALPEALDAPEIPEAVLKSVSEWLEDAGHPKARAERINALRHLIHAQSPNIEMPVDRVLWVPIELVEANDYNPNSVAKIEMGLLYTSIKHDGYCVEKSTPVLMADLTWREAGDLRPGDEIISFDEEPSVEKDGARSLRRYRTGTVTYNFVQPSQLLRVKTDKGEVKVTPDHPFLAYKSYGKGHHQAQWVEAQDLSAGDKVVHLLSPWEFDDSWESGWLSGFLDGEGSMSKTQRKSRTSSTYRLAVAQAEGPTADRMVREMQRRCETTTLRITHADHPHWKTQVLARAGRFHEIMRLLGTVRPERLLRNAGRFWEGTSIHAQTKGGSKAVVELVEDAGVGEIASLSTDTKTYIAGGFAMHNTMPVVTIYDEERGKFVIVDGFHRYHTMRSNADIYDRCHGLLPVVVIDKDINDRMASTVRHNRARGAHSIEGMSGMVFDMLNNGWSDADVCNELGMQPEELIRLKHITGFSALFKDAEYSKAWKTKAQIRLEKKWREEHGDPSAPSSDTNPPEE